MFPSGRLHKRTNPHKKKKKQYENFRCASYRQLHSFLNVCKTMRSAYSPHQITPNDGSLGIKTGDCKKGHKMNKTNNKPWTLHVTSVNTANKENKKGKERKKKEKNSKKKTRYSRVLPYFNYSYKAQTHKTHNTSGQTAPRR